MLGVSRVASILGWDKLVSDLGGDPSVIYHQIDWDLSELTDPDATIPTRTAANLLAQSAKLTDCPHFSLLLARQRDLNNYLGLLGQILNASATIGDALKEGVKRYDLHSQGAGWELNTEGNISNVTRQIDGFLELSAVQVTQLSIGMMWRLMRLLSDGRWHPTMVSFRFSRPGNTLVYKRFFDVPVLFGADENTIVFHSQDLLIPLPRQDQYLLNVLKSFADTQRMSRRRTLKDEVKYLVRKNLQNGITDIEHVARFFPFEQRTLQRKLTALGSGYRQLLQEVRMEVAKDRLLNSDVPIARLADSLDYSDQGSFTKAFKSQTGNTPSAWRRQARRKTFTIKDS
jgi:AraC-like DNA-binding protein